MGDARVRTFELRQVVEHGPGLKSFYFDWPFDAEPGQFVNLWLPGVDEKPFSISDLHGGRLELSVRAVGPFTRALMECRPGARLGLRGPFGTGFRLEADGVLVAGGTGLAPLRFLARRLRERGLRHRLVVGVRTRSDLLFPDALSDAELASEDGSIGEQGRVTRPLGRLLERGDVRQLYGAGPEPMLLAVRALAEARGVPYQLSFERYMKCGVGLCGQCCLDGSGIRVCVEGPVLGPAELAGITELGEPHRDASGSRRCRCG